MRAFLVLLLVAAANAASLLKASEPISGQYIVKIKVKLQRSYREGGPLKKKNSSFAIVM